jgi:hypothetical protein
MGLCDVHTHHVGVAIHNDSHAATFAFVMQVMQVMQLMQETHVGDHARPQRVAKRRECSNKVRCHEFFYANQKKWSKLTWAEQIG